MEKNTQKWRKNLEMTKKCCTFANRMKTRCEKRVIATRKRPEGNGLTFKTLLYDK